MTSPSTDRRYGVNSGLGIKAPVLAASTANLTLSGEQTVDGTALVTGNRVLVKNQTATADNGIYVVDTGAWTRDLDFDGNRDIAQGTLIFIVNGGTNGGTIWEVTTATPVIGSSLAFAQLLGTLSNASSITYNPGGTGAVATTVQTKLLESVSVLDFGADNTGSVDATTAIQNAYTAASNTSKILYIPAGTYKITSSLIFNKDVDVYGAGILSTTILKYGNINGIVISNNTTYLGQQSTYAGFNVTSQSGSGDTAGTGIQVFAVYRMRMSNIACINHGSHGFLFDQSGGVAGGEMGYFELLTTTGNGGDGIKTNNINTSTWIGLNCRSNTGVGFHMENSDEHYGTNINCELNLSNGIRINGSYGNFLAINVESCGSETSGGAGASTWLTSTANNNMLTGRCGNTSSSIQNDGVGNSVIDWQYANVFQSGGFGPIKTESGVAGAAVSFFGGTSKGGNANGGALYIDGGSKQGSGTDGNVIIGSNSGYKLEPKQPSFSAYGTNTAAVTGDGTAYSIPFANEVFDTRSNLSGTTFTAPVAGIYVFDVTVYLQSLGAAHTTGNIALTCTGKTYYLFLGNVGAIRDNSNELCLSGSITHKMAAGETAQVVVTVSNSTKTVAIAGVFTTFAGSLQM